MVICFTRDLYQFSWNSESVQYQLLMRVILVIEISTLEEIVCVKKAVCFEMIVSET